MIPPCPVPPPRGGVAVADGVLVVGADGRAVVWDGAAWRAGGRGPAPGAAPALVRVGRDAAIVLGDAAGRWEAGRFEPIAPPPVGRGVAATVTRAGDVWVGGGEIGDRPVDTVATWDPAADRWIEGAPLPVARTRAAAWALYDGRVAVVGGDSPDDAALLDVTLCDGAARTVVPAGPPRGDGDARMALHTALLLGDGRLLAFVGSTVRGGRGAYSGCGASIVFDPAAATWGPPAPLPEPVFLLGGAGRAAVAPVRGALVFGDRDVVRWDGARWYPFLGAPRLGRTDVAVLADDGHVLALAGERGAWVG